MNNNVEWVLDTETTGTNAKSGDRILEIGAIELVNKKPTGRVFHEYIDPEIEVPEEVVEIHGITRDEAISLGNGQKFKDVADKLLNLVSGTSLVMHNAPFDMGFLNMEFERLGREPLSNHVTVMDTLQLAKSRFPNSRNTLDALCKRYDIDNKERDYHGALLDAELLSKVYYSLSASQQSLKIDNRRHQANTSKSISYKEVSDPGVILDVSDTTRAEHKNHLENIKEGLSWDF